MSRIYQTFLDHVETRGSELAIWSRGEGTRRTFNELSDDVDAVSEALRGHPGPIGIATGNCLAFPTVFLACRRLGIPAVSVDCASENDLVELARALGLRWIVHRGPSGVDLDGTVRLLEIESEHRPTPSGTALVKLTSGTTGEPTGICLSDDALMAGIRQIAEGMALTAADRVLVAIPLSHSYGFDNGVLSLAVVGTPPVLQPQVFPRPILRALDEGEITFLPLVPPLVRALGQAEWPERLPLRTVICAGGPLDPEFAAAFAERSGRPVSQFFGSTETGGITFESRPDERGARETVGRPLPNVTVDLDEDGSVRIRSKANFGGIWGEDEELSSRIVATGDTAEWTRCGRLRLTGRSADLFNIGGRRVSARSVERSIKELPAVRDVAVVGVADPVRGDRLVAFVVPTSDDVGQIDCSRLPKGWAPRQVRMVRDLPYTPRGKLDRALLRKEASS